MVFAPQTFNVLQGIQWRVQNEVKVGGVSPFSDFNVTASNANPSGASDFTRFNTPANPGGTINQAIYIGLPKDVTQSYPKFCTIIPLDDKAYWRSNNRVFDEVNVYIRCWWLYRDDWWSVFQEAMATRDALQTMILAHAELPAVAEVEAMKQVNAAKNNQVGFFFDEVEGNDWYCYATSWWTRQQWLVQNLIQP